MVYKEVGDVIYADGATAVAGVLGFGYSLVHAARHYVDDQKRRSGSAVLSRPEKAHRKNHGLLKPKGGKKPYRKRKIFLRTLLRYKRPIRKFLKRRFSKRLPKRRLFLRKTRDRVIYRNHRRRYIHK